MPTDELIKELDALKSRLDARDRTEGSVISILCGIVGALHEGVEYELANHVTYFTTERLHLIHQRN